MADGGYLVNHFAGRFNILATRTEPDRPFKFVLNAARNTFVVSGTRSGILGWLWERRHWQVTAVTRNQEFGFKTGEGDAKQNLILALRPQAVPLGQVIQATYAGAALGGLPGVFAGGSAGIFTSPGGLTGGAALAGMGIGAESQYATIDASGAFAEAAQAALDHVGRTPNCVNRVLAGAPENDPGYSLFDRLRDKLGGDKYHLFVTHGLSYGSGSKNSGDTRPLGDLVTLSDISATAQNLDW